MKKWMIWICMSLLCAGAWADDVYRAFTNAEGKSFRGRVLSFDARKGIVQIEAENKNKAKIPLTALSEQDQLYVREWNTAQDFLNERLFRISCDDRLLDKSKEEEREDITWRNTGNTEADRLMNTITREKIGFEFEFKNSTPTLLHGIRMEYRIYYEQSKMSKEASRPEPKQNVYKGKKDLADIPPGEVITLMTEPVEIYKDDVNPLDNQVGGDPRQGGEGEVHGLRARLYMKLSTGEEVVREFGQPSSMKDDRYPW